MKNGVCGLLFVGAVLIVLLNTALRAADSQVDAQAQVVHFFKHSGALNLTDDQRRQCDAVAKEFGEQARVKGADIDAIKSEELVRIVAILTKDQLETLDKLKVAESQGSSRRSR